ncbi:MAG: beta-propeller fold lactonase family protein [Burkholderiaceae bacterium]
MKNSSASKIRLSRLSLGALALTALLSACGGGGGGDKPSTPARAVNQLYTQSNEVSNVVVHFQRMSDGTIVRKESTATGGTGTNAVGPNGMTGPDSLASQHAVIVDPDGKTLFAVNAGDNSISVFTIDAVTGGLTLKKRSAVSAGQAPNSLALNNGVLYATFLKGSAQLAALKVGADGALTQIGAYDLVALTGISTSAPTQVIAAPDAKHVVVSAGTRSNAVVSFSINADGTLANPVANTENIATPFAAQFLPGASTPTYLSTGIAAVSLTSYNYNVSTGKLAQVSQDVAAGVAAPCWLSITPDGKVAFVGNGSGAISSFSIDAQAQVKLLNAQAAVEPSALAGVPSVAGDSWISPDGKFLYTAYLGADKIVAYAIGQNGSLAKLNEVAVGTATKLSLQGLVGL